MFKKTKKLLIIIALLFPLALGGCAETNFLASLFKDTKPPPQQKGYFKVGNPYEVAGTRYYPREAYSFEETGIASWYGPGFHGKRTANGERFDKNELTAAHRTLQLPSLVRVTNLENGRSLIVRVNDRGPFSRGRIIDVSAKAAELLGFKGRGTARVKLQVLTQESLQIAEAARAGKDTRGVEVALNRGQPMPGMNEIGVPRPPGSLQTAAIPPVETLPATVSGYTKSGVFYPDAKVAQMPVMPTAIYIQTGAFSLQQNAQKQANALAQFGKAHVIEAHIGGETLYRVRLGPLENVAAADKLLGSVLMSIPQAIIVIDKPL